jgi:signal transduction histidine kinase
METIREEERTSIAREIHDELGQQLTGLKMDISWLNKKVPKENKVVHEKISGMLSLVDATVKMVRRIATELRPGILDDLGLIDALQWQSHEFEKRTGITCSFSTTFKDPVFEKHLSTGIFRVFQETLTNVARHAKASEIMTVLEKNDDSIVLQVHDNGQGFNETEIKGKKTLGLVGMKERAKMFGGNLTIQSAAGKGTKIILRVPMRLTGITELELIK